MRRWNANANANTNTNTNVTLNANSPQTPLHIIQPANLPAIEDAPYAFQLTRAVLAPGLKTYFLGYSTSSLCFPHPPVMGSFVQYLSSIVKAGQSFCGPRHGCTLYYMLSLTLFFFSLPTVTVAFTTSHSVATQCSPFTVTWNWSGSADGPPFLLLILPFGAQSTIVEVPHTDFNATTMTGSYTLDKFPLKSGTQFIVSMLYGEGALFTRLI